MVYGERLIKDFNHVNVVLEPPFLEVGTTFLNMSNEPDEYYIVEHIEFRTSIISALVRKLFSKLNFVACTLSQVQYSLRMMLQIASCQLD